MIWKDTRNGEGVKERIDMVVFEVEVVAAAVVVVVAVVMVVDMEGHLEWRME